MTIEGANTLSGWGIAPHIVVNDVKLASRFYQKAFGAEVIFYGGESQGSMAHARLRIGEASLGGEQDERRLEQAGANHWGRLGFGDGDGTRSVRLQAMRFGLRTPVCGGGCKGESKGNEDNDGRLHG